MPLTWREVTAPDFSAAQRGFDSFSNLLGNALGGAERALGKFDAAKTDRINNEIAIRALQYSDPAAYAQAVADGTIVGPDPSRVTAATASMLGDRSTALLRDQQLTGQNAEQAFKFQDLKSDETARDAAAPIIAEAARLRSIGKDADADALMATPAAKAAFGAMDLRDQTNAYTTNQALAAGYRTNRGADQRFNIDAYAQMTTEERDKAVKDSQAFVVKADHTIGNYGDYERMKFDPKSDYASLSPQAKLAVDVYYQNRFGTTGGSAGGASGSSTSPTGTGNGTRDPTNIMNYEARAAGFQRVPDTVKTLGDASDFALTVNRAGVESSAMGTFQIVGSNLRGWAKPGGGRNVGYGEKVFGAGWRDVPWTAENQDRIAEAIFNDNKADPEALRRQWVSLSSAEAARISRLPWAQARDVIARGESGVASADPTELAAMARRGMAQVRGQNQDSAMFAQYEAASNNIGAGFGTVTGQLVGKDGVFAGARPAYVTDTIQTIARRYNVSAAVAGLILSNSSTKATDGFLNTGWFGENSGNGLKVDWNLVKSNADKYKRWDTQRGAGAQDSSARAEQELTAAESAYKTASDRLAARRAQAINQPGLSLSEEILAYEQARKAYSDAAIKLGRDSTLSSLDPGRTPAPPPKPPSGWGSTTGSSAISLFTPPSPAGAILTHPLRAAELLQNAAARRAYEMTRP